MRRLRTRYFVQSNSEPVRVKKYSMVFYKLPQAIGYNPVYPFALLISRRSWFFVTSQRDRAWSIGFALVSILVSSFLYFAWLGIINLTTGNVTAISVTVFLLLLLRLIQRGRDAVWAEHSEATAACVAHRMYLWEWVGFCLSMTFSLLLVADTFAIPAISVLLRCLFLLGVPLAHISMYRLREATNGRNRRLSKTANSRTKVVK